MAELFNASDIWEPDPFFRNEFHSSLKHVGMCTYVCTIYQLVQCIYVIVIVLHKYPCWKHISQATFSWSNHFPFVWLHQNSKWIYFTSNFLPASPNLFNSCYEIYIIIYSPFKWRQWQRFNWIVISLPMRNYGAGLITYLHFSFTFCIIASLNFLHSEIFLTPFLLLFYSFSLL